MKAEFVPSSRGELVAETQVPNNLAIRSGELVVKETGAPPRFNMPDQDVVLISRHELLRLVSLQHFAELAMAA